jgi:8-oxo-dGTP diphosphatase
MPKSNQKEVAAGILIRPDGRFLLAKRPEGKTWQGYWEFPGGKIEDGETSLEALGRELKEEIGITVKQAFPWVKLGHLNFFKVTRWEGEISGIEGQVLSWQSAEGLDVMPIIPANFQVINALALPSIYAITNSSELSELSFFHILQQKLKTKSISLIQVREKQLNQYEVKSFCEKLFRICEAYPNIKIMLNSYHYYQNPELIRLFNFDGIHWTSNDLKQLRIKFPDLLNAGSCHTAAELSKCAQLGFDFVALSPIKPTLSHPNTQLLGWENFKSLISEYNLPTYALGGLTADDIETAWQHGGQGVAMQRAVWK